VIVARARLGPTRRRLVDITSYIFNTHDDTFGNVVDNERFWNKCGNVNHDRNDNDNVTTACSLTTIVHCCYNGKRRERERKGKVCMCLYVSDSHSRCGCVASCTLNEVHIHARVPGSA